MVRRDATTYRKPEFFALLLSAAIVCALGGQLNATGPAEEAGDAASALTKDRTRDRPAPASLAEAIEARGFWLGSRAQLPPKQEPIRIATPDWLQQGGQAQVELAEDDHNWVVVEGAGVNVRAGPSVRAQRIGNMTRGKRLRVLERGKKWTRIEDPLTSQSGWMWADYLAETTPRQRAESNPGETAAKAPSSGPG